MGKVKEKKEQITSLLIDIFDRINIDTPSNFEEILEFVYDDVCETADPENWSDGDVAIAFRRWIEKQSIPKNNTRPNYFNIASQGWNKGLQREEIQIHCGENGNLMIIKTDEGFVVDAYDVDGENINTMTVWEDDINPLDEDEQPRDEDGILTTCPVCDSENTRKDYDFPTTMRCCESCFSEWNDGDDITLNGREIV